MFAMDKRVSELGIFAGLAAVLSLSACKRNEPPPATVGLPPVSENNPAVEPFAANQQAQGAEQPLAELTTAEQAYASLQPTKGNDVKGTVKLIREGQRVHITGQITGLSPGEHGFHIHEHGDCSAADATSAGGHFSPGGHPHGDPDSEVTKHHVGDFGNITANKQGVAQVDRWETLPVLNVGESFVVGKAFIVHSGKDDLTTQPSGDAGSRVACGVIEPGPSGT